MVFRIFMLKFSTKTTLNPQFHLPMKDTVTGQSRVVIEGVYPEIDGDKMPIKRIVDPLVCVEVDIYADGHDAIAGCLLYKHEQQKKWQEIPLESIVNDKWKSTFKVSKQGYYNYSSTAWVNQGITWGCGIQKKINAEEHVDVKFKNLITDASYIWNKEWNLVELDSNGLPFPFFKIII